MPNIWEKYPNLSADEIRTLAACAAQVLLESETGAAQFPADFLGISERGAARQLAPLLQDTIANLDEANIRKFLADEGLTAQTCQKILDEVRQHPALAQRVADVYSQRAQKMAVPELMLLTGALVILAIKIKKVSWNAKGGQVDFESSAGVVKNFVAGLFKSILGR